MDCLCFYYDYVANGGRDCSPTGFRGDNRQMDYFKVNGLSVCHAITGSGALCFGDLIIPANSLTASSVWVFGPGCFAVLVGGLKNPIEP